jgi:hypothetical protein
MRRKDVLNLKQASFELGAANKGFTHFDECSDSEDAHLNAFGAIGNIGSHDSAMLNEGIGQFSPPTMAGIGRKLRPDIRRT